MKKRSDFTAQDVEFIHQHIGIMPARVIADHIGSTIDCVTHYCRRNDIMMFDSRYDKGLPIYYLSKIWNCNNNTITAFVNKNNLPLIATNNTLGRTFRIVDMKRIPDWLKSGYALSNAIQPTITEYVRMLEVAREAVINQMIPSSFLRDILSVHYGTIYKWIRHGKLPMHDFKFANILYHKRVPLSMWMMKHYGKQEAELVRTMKWSI
jgi:hypothetical protein